MRRNIALLAIATAIIIQPCFGAGERFRFDSIRRGQRQFALTAGYGGIHRMPSNVRDSFSFDIIKARYGWFTSPRTEVGVNLAFEKPNTDKDNHAITGTVTYRRYFLVRGSTALAFDIGAGISHFYEKLLSLGTHTNFTEAMGLVFQSGLGPRSALTLEYTFSHTSNAGMKLPNIGVNASALAVGVTWYP